MKHRRSRATGFGFRQISAVGRLPALGEMFHVTHLFININYFYKKPKSQSPTPAGRQTGCEKFFDRIYNTNQCFV